MRTTVSQGILFEELNPTGSRPSDLIGLCKPTTAPPHVFLDPLVMHVLASDIARLMMMFITNNYYIGERLKLEGKTENMGFCTKEQEGMTAEVLMATPCTKSL